MQICVGIDSLSVKFVVKRFFCFSPQSESQESCKTILSFLGEMLRVSRTPVFFSHHLLWHVSGNKQNVINKERFVRAELVQEQLRDYAKDLR